MLLLALFNIMPHQLLTHAAINEKKMTFIDNKNRLRWRSKPKQ
jgi:hypothetical protein